MWHVSSTCHMLGKIPTQTNKYTFERYTYLHKCDVTTLPLLKVGDHIQVVILSNACQHSATKFMWIITAAVRLFHQHLNFDDWRQRGNVKNITCSKKSFNFRKKNWLLLGLEPSAKSIPHDCEVLHHVDWAIIIISVVFSGILLEFFPLFRLQPAVERMLITALTHRNKLEVHRRGYQALDVLMSAV